MHGEKWYVKSFRRNLVDMHIDGWNEEFLSHFDPKEYFRCLKAGKIQSPMIYTHSHVGYCNWPTKTGEMHPAFNGVNKIKELFDLCHKDRMDVIAYYSLIYNNRIYLSHPEWRMRDIDGNASRDPKKSDGELHMMIGQGRYGLICPNSDGYRDFLKKQFAELCETYEFEAIFLDMTFWPMICHCDNCRRRFKTETGLDIPQDIDWEDPVWLRFQKAREDWMGEFARFTSAELKKLRPELDIEHQFSTATHPWTFGVRSAVSEACDYTGGDLYGGFEQQSFICKLYYGITRNQPFEYMTSRCDPGLFDHTTTKSEEMLKLHAFLTYAHHGAFLAIDAIDPRGTLNGKFYELLGKVFDDTIAYEPFFTGTMTADVAVYFSLGSKMDTRTKGKKRAVLDKPVDGYPHLASSLGAGIALRQAHIPYGVVTDGKYGEIGKYKAIVLSDLAFMTVEEEDAVISYVRSGGALYMSGISSPRIARELLGLEIQGMTEEKVTYIRPCDRGANLFCGMYDAMYPMTVFGAQVLAANKGQGEVLGKLTLPYTNPSDYTRLASIHSNPPGIDTEYPSIVMGSAGEGKVIWTAAPFESSGQPVHKQVFANLVGLLTNGRNLVVSDAPHFVEFTVFEDEESGKVLLHCVNIQETFPMIRIPGFSVSLRSDKKVSSIKSLPTGTEIPFKQKDGYVRFEVSSIDIFRMFEIVM